MYRTHRCSVHVASYVSIYGYGTPPPQDRARIARGLMYVCYMYMYVHEVLLLIIYIIVMVLGVS